eukprot:TRINITY_DN68308_c0_g1_i1.p1 TRINITY_DN68308_c0_g1~~TRINITY_DN68308_c0_g1_i1.p1  ORF type:complete len:669 (+),score=27.77 TRINITY_DN68308_c0_g1_i1:66-2009(+)
MHRHAVPPASPYPRLTIGPVIGLVTDSTARVLVESPVGGLLTCILYAPNDQPYQSQAQANPNRPVVFSWAGLPSATRFRVVVNGFGHVQSSFSTFSSFPTLDEKLAFGAVACNKYRITQQIVKPHGDVFYGVVRDILAGKLHMLIHLGDQVYADDDFGKLEKGKKTMDEIVKYSCFAQCLRMAEQTPDHQWDAIRPQIIDKFRQLYREAWSHPPTAQMLANIPNLMVYDDHEIRDDLGDKPEHFQRNKIRLVLECGRKACVEYQRQLMGDVDIGDEYFAPILQRENHFIGSWGEYGVIITDSRGAKTFNPQPNDPLPYLGSPQWAEIDAALAPGGEMDQCRVLLMCCQIPLIFFPRELTEKLAPRADDFEGHWCYGKTQHEQYKLMEGVNAWLSRDPLNRNVIVVGGDMHLGGHTHVFRFGKYQWSQLLVGPVSNTSPAMAFKASKLLNSTHNQLGRGWHYNHYGWNNDRNVGIIATGPKMPYIMTGHIWGSNKKPSTWTTWGTVKYNPVQEEHVKRMEKQKKRGGSYSPAPAPRGRSHSRAPPTLTHTPRMRRSRSYGSIDDARSIRSAPPSPVPSLPTPGPTTSAYIGAPSVPQVISGAYGPSSLGPVGSGSYMAGSYTSSPFTSATPAYSWGASSPAVMPYNFV